MEIWKFPQIKKIRLYQTSSSTQMGLSGFYKLIEKEGYVPNTICLEDLRGKTVAIDGDFVMYLALHGQTSGKNVSAADISRHIAHWLRLAESAGVHVIFVTTGGPPPLEKQLHCSVIRKRKRDQQQEKIDELEKNLTSIDDIGETVCLREKICRLENGIRCISTKMSTDVVDLLVENGHNCMRAKSEADFLLVLLSEEKKCDYVATDDGDIIVAGASKVLRGFVRMLTRSQNGRVFCRSDVLTSLKLASEELLELGILLGCDYQAQLGNVGPITALAMIRQHGSVAAFLASDMFDGVQKKSKKRKYTLPPGKTRDDYIISSARSVQIFLSRPDKEISPEVVDVVEAISPQNVLPIFQTPPGDV
jgi:flap endonuclease-1